MKFPIEFAKSTGRFDIISPFINFTGNAAVVAVGGISLGAISMIALKALGFSATATAIATAIPVSIGAFGVAGLIVGGAILISILVAASKALGRYL